MSWYNYSKVKCERCNYECTRSNDTLSVADKNHNKCPKCSGNLNIKGKIIRMEDCFKK